MAALFKAIPVFWILLMSSKICNNTYNKGWSHYFLKKLLTLGEETNLRKKQICCRMMTSSKTMVTSKSRSHDQSNVARLMLTFLLKSKDVLYQVSSDLGEVKIFYSSFSDAGQKALSCLAKVWKSRPDIGLTFFHELVNMFIFIGYITVQIYSFLSFHFPIFYSKIHKRNGTFFESGGYFYLVKLSQHPKFLWLEISGDCTFWMPPFEIVIFFLELCDFYLVKLS